MEDNFAMGYALGQDGNKSNDGMFGGEGWWAIILFAMIFGWGRNGFGGNDAGIQGALTRSDLCSEFAFNDLQNGVRGISQGICDSTFALNNAVTNGFHGVDNAICTLGYQTQVGFNALGTQLSNCCCDLRTGQMNTDRLMERGFCDTNYNMATNTTAIIQNAHNDADRVIAKLDAMEMSRKDETINDLRAQVQALNLAKSQSNQNAVLMADNAAQTAELIRRCCPAPVPAYTVPAPYPYGYERGCGCGF